ncbi:MAG: sigma-70 family RNA polymerase sigma factor [Myxococcales bacterium]|nr:sigma-70 family RNA polymerase sigma factor [Myxococcales bacterium]
MGALWTAFFVSGVAGLSYELTWVRYLSHVFGATTPAVAATVAVFFGGTALGSAIGGRWFSRRSRPALAYAGLEACIGLCGLALPAVFGWLDQALAARDDLPQAPAQPRWPDLYLAVACTQGDQAALRAFERRVMPEADAAIRGIDREPAFVDEVRQRVRTKLLVAEPGHPPKLADYAGRGPLAGWLSVVALRTALNLVRDRRRADPLAGDRWAAALVLPATDDLELEHLKQSYGAELREALVEASRTLSDRERAVLRLCFVDGLSIDRIGAIYGVHRSTAARWLQRARAGLHEATRERLAARLRTTPTQLSSVDRLVHSQIDVSLGGLLAEPEPSP